jgi:hypothetical protein
VAATVTVVTVWAHHRPAAFDLRTQVAIQGTLTRVEWDYAPDQPLLRFACDPDQARRFTLQ